MDEKVRALEWFVQFANMDLDTLSLGDRAKILVESEEFLFSRSKGYSIQQVGPIVGQKKRIISENNSVASFKDVPRDSPEYWVRVLESQAKIKKRLENFLSPNGNIRLSLNKVSVWLVWNDTFRLSLRPITKSYEDYLDLKLFGLLDNLPYATIQKCPGCKKFFLNPSLRRKKFCSPRCMWRVNAEKRRQADPEGYRKNQRDLMRKKYIEKQAQERGVSVDKIKLQKRRRRKENEEVELG